MRRKKSAGHPDMMAGYKARGMLTGLDAKTLRKLCEVSGRHVYGFRFLPIPFPRFVTHALFVKAGVREKDVGYILTELECNPESMLYFMRTRANLLVKGEVKKEKSHV